jgi:hypothetical protein
MKHIAAILSLLLLFIPSSQARTESKRIREQVDPYNGRRTLLLTGIPTRPCSGDPPRGGDITLSITAVQLPYHQVSFLLATDIASGPFLDLRDGSTMDTIMDHGIGYLVTTHGSSINSTYDRYERRSHTHEYIPFHVTSENLMVLARSKTFEFRINGDRQAVQRCATKKDLRDLAEFLDAAREYYY